MPTRRLLWVILGLLVMLTAPATFGGQPAAPPAGRPPVAGEAPRTGQADPLQALLAQFGASKQTVMLPMTDGAKMATDVYLPPGTGPFSVVFARTPYGRTQMGPAAILALTRGHGCVLQDMRGRFDSEGENLPFIGCGWEEPHDGVDTMAWLLKQTWCNGKVGTVGPSALGITQNLLAGAAPPGLTAQYIQVASANLFADAAYVGGAFRKEQVEGWYSSHKFDPKAAEIWQAHAVYDDYWKRFDSTLKHSVMNAPAVHMGGWFDTFSQGTIDSFVGRQYHGAAGAKGTQKLVIGPWEHGIGGSGRVGELTFPGGSPPKQYDVVRWFDATLKGEDNGMLKEPAVAYYVMGDVETPGAPGNQWRYSDVWPIPCAETPYYLAKDGGLSTAKPAAAGEASRQYTFDPADPCPTLGGRNLNIAKGPKNQNSIESRPDVLTFTTEPLAEPVEVTGRLWAKVWVSSSAVDTDLSVRFCDVYPDGRSFLMTDGMLRLRYRNSLAKTEPLVPGKAYEAAVDCWSTSIVINKGHRIRATVTSSNHPRFDANPGTGQPAWAEGVQAVKQTNRIFCDAEHPSRIILPVVKQAVPATPAI